MLIDIAEGVNLSLDAEEIEVESEIQDEELRTFEMEKVTERRKSAVLESQKTNRALATNLLQILGPHNWIRCGHCGSKEEGGNRCKQCGRAIEFQ